MKKIFPESQTILFVAPHPDDEVIWAGAFLKKLAPKNKVFVAFVLSEENPRKKEALKASKFLNINPLFLDLSKEKLKLFSKNPTEAYSIQSLLLRVAPQIIFLPHKKDIHPTHKLTHQVFQKVIGKTKKELNIEEIWQYDGWSLIEKPNFIYYFNQEKLKEKLKALSFYKTQIKRTPFKDLVLGLALLRGATGYEILNGFGSISKIKEKYGEAFWREKI